jgi:hypothetical protein
MARGRVACQVAANQIGGPEGRLGADLGPIFSSIFPMEGRSMWRVSLALLILASAAAGAEKVRFIRAFVVDQRMSALRRRPDQQSEALRRLRLGRQVFIIASGNRAEPQGKYYRVAISRRTRGFVHEAALFVPGRAGEDERLLKLIESSTDSLDKMLLCNLFISHLKGSRLMPRALFLMGQEAERVAEALSHKARKHIEGASRSQNGPSLRDLYLNYSGLDPYSRLGVRFDFDERTSEYIYDGQAYRALIRLFPKSQEAALARERLRSHGL